MESRIPAVDWDRLGENYARWWDGSLGRPLLRFATPAERPPACAEPLPGMSPFIPCLGEGVPDALVVREIDYLLSRLDFLGDAFPAFWPNYGPGILAAFMGGAVHADRVANTVWFRSPEDRVRELADYPDWDCDAENPWFKRVEATLRTARQYWRGRVQLGMTDLGGALDVISTFRPSELLPMDLFDHPDEVKRRIGQVHRAWWKAFEVLDATLRDGNHGYTAWDPILSATPSYMLQCDFAYMLGPDHFEEFVLPELAACCRRLDHAFYHLDGVGQLIHLDKLLAIPELKGIQWVPGDGKPDHGHWPEVVRKVRDAGKRLQLGGTCATFECIVEQLGGDASCVVYTLLEPAGRRREAEALLQKFKAFQ